MRSRKHAAEPAVDRESLANVVEGLKKFYKDKVLPVEQKYCFHDLYASELSEQDFDAKPSVLLCGQYSTGKTTFIKYLLNDSFPGDLVGAHLTTDRFIAIMHGNEENVIPGHAAVVDPTKNFKPLEKFGNAFLQRFQISQKNSPLLRSFTIIDSPGILSGDAQQTPRGYDFIAVLQWFSARVDKIIIFFDAYKFDISDEVQSAIDAFRGHDEKIRIVLNKAGSVDQQQLMRIYGALMWSLGKNFLSSEVARVYIGSFWDEPLRNNHCRKFFESEENELFLELQMLPHTVVQRKFNDLVKRARQCRVNAFVISALREKYEQSVFNRASRKKEALRRLPRIFGKIEKEHDLSRFDLPDINEIRQKLEAIDWGLFGRFDKNLLHELDYGLATEVAALAHIISHEQLAVPTGNMFASGCLQKSIFNYGRGEGADRGSLQKEWVVEKHRFLAEFNRVKDAEGLVNGARAKEVMIKSNLPNSTLGRIWMLADTDKDGALDEDEFCLAMHLLELKLDGHSLPLELPRHLIPVAKRASSDMKSLKLID